MKINWFRYASMVINVLSIVLLLNMEIPFWKAFGGLTAVIFINYFDGLWRGRNG